MHYMLFMMLLETSHVSYPFWQLIHIPLGIFLYWFPAFYRENFIHCKKGNKKYMHFDDDKKASAIYFEKHGQEVKISYL